jgi:transposase
MRDAVEVALSCLARERVHIERPAKRDISSVDYSGAGQPGDFRARLETSCWNLGQHLARRKRNHVCVAGQVTSTWIGPLTGSILLSVIGDIHDFADEGKLAAYFGIVPRVNNSNETERSGRITKRGSKLGRTALVQCALIAQRYSPYLKKFYEKTKARRGTGKAIIALARKLLGIVYRTLKNNWVFQDFPNFVLAEES